MPDLYLDLSLHTHVLLLFISLSIAVHLASSHASYLTCPVFLAVFGLASFGQKGLDVQGLPLGVRSSVAFACAALCCLFVYGLTERGEQVGKYRT